MKLTKVERTPNPLAMKLSVDEYLEAGTVGVTYTRNQRDCRVISCAYLRYRGCIKCIVTLILLQWKRQ